jgi:hypothetical protein
MTQRKFVRSAHDKYTNNVTCGGSIKYFDCEPNTGTQTEKIIATVSNLPTSQVHVLCKVAPCVVLPMGQLEQAVEPAVALYVLVPQGEHDREAPDPD